MISKGQAVECASRRRVRPASNCSMKNITRFHSKLLFTFCFVDIVKSFDSLSVFHKVKGEVNEKAIRDQRHSSDMLFCLFWTPHSDEEIFVTLIEQFTIAFDCFSKIDLSFSLLDKRSVCNFHLVWETPIHFNRIFIAPFVPMRGALLSKYGQISKCLFFIIKIWIILAKQGLRFFLWEEISAWLCSKL